MRRECMPAARPMEVTCRFVWRSRPGQIRRDCSDRGVVAEQLVQVFLTDGGRRALAVEGNRRSHFALPWGFDGGWPGGSLVDRRDH